MCFSSLPLPALALDSDLGFLSSSDEARCLDLCATIDLGNRNLRLQLPKQQHIVSSSGRLRPLGALSEPVTLPGYGAQDPGTMRQSPALCLARNMPADRVNLPADRMAALCLPRQHAFMLGRVVAPRSLILLIPAYVKQRCATPHLPREA